MTDTLRTIRPTEIQLGGEIDIANAGFLTRELCDAVDRATSVIVDVSAVTFIDARGVAMMVAVHEHARALGRTITWRGAQPMPARVFSITGVDRALDIDR